MYNSFKNYLQKVLKYHHDIIMLNTINLLLWFSWILHFPLLKEKVHTFHISRLFFQGEILEIMIYLFTCWRTVFCFSYAFSYSFSFIVSSRKKWPRFLYSIIQMILKGTRLFLHNTDLFLKWYTKQCRKIAVITGWLAILWAT